MKAIWNGEIIAESDETIVVEGNHYFPHDSVNKEFLKPSPTRTMQTNKGEASYYSIIVNNRINEDAAWYYPKPTSEAQQIKNYIAFWKGVEVID
ncbi:DUF427 domain-containing protein [Candidatus Nomurabacteria bacterium]|uniref:DUF427 domain-containing protein n=1 Tax=candidate division WWE3 bacterium TaxID=2053526 RepID=A0A955IW92_UNCKA|nr:DUF427 domain-containing protein [candidate division WWE3 bacterium]MCB9823875.1 DUF427 domain-containing protein [Candidatus Nomurabacteria bacterium]MCB9827145.1 DUF427 domain-containing protein [Candidatus Nomurabacteria bacterium]MCB9827814.1 DUF427 domain-containing protein [Candidatus Nomurabacteria bacterium]